MSSSTSASQTAALEEAFNGVTKALGAEKPEGQPYFTRAARKDLLKLLGDTVPVANTNTVLQQRILQLLEAVKNDSPTLELDFNKYAGDIKCVAFLLYSIQNLEKHAEEEAKNLWLGEPNNGEACDTAENRADQVLVQNESLLFSRQNRSALRLMLAALKYAWMGPYKERLDLAMQRTDGPRTFVPGEGIRGDSLRTFDANPVLTAPLVCQLCDEGFTLDRHFAQHIQTEHVLDVHDVSSAEREYRKRVLYLMSLEGCRPITGQEKRIILQNCAHFQQFSRPGANGNTFADSEPVPRAEAACVFCAQKDWLEHRHKLHLFDEAPSDAKSDEELDPESNDRITITVLF